jgi:hypothetical protein
MEEEGGWIFMPESKKRAQQIERLDSCFNIDFSLSHFLSASFSLITASITEHWNFGNNDINHPPSSIINSWTNDAVLDGR